MKFTPSGMATAVGSLPYRDAGRAVETMLDAFPRLPAWPQLPQRTFLENMYVQFSEGLPCLAVDREKERIYFDTERDVMAEMELFYGRLIENAPGSFAVSEEYAAGFQRMRAALEKDEARRAALSGLKGQIVGPVSFGLTVTDQKRRAILYHDDLMDAVVKTIAMKAAWEVRELKKLCPRVMVWLDEPYLASFGSGYVSLSEEQVLSFIGEAVEAIHSEGGLAGIHCCGNTDWSLLMKSELDVINFDAYDYFTGMTLYPEGLRAWFEKGRLLAIGLIPTSEKAREETVESLAAALGERLEALSAKTGVEAGAIWRQSLLTPSCGTGTLREDLAERVLDLTGFVSKAARI